MFSPCLCYVPYTKNALQIKKNVTNTELLQACGQIWRPVQQVTVRKVNPWCFVVAENTPKIPLSRMACCSLAHAHTCCGRCSWWCPVSRSASLGARFRRGGGTLAPIRCGDKVQEFCEGVHVLCPAPRREHVLGKVVNLVPLSRP